MAFDAGAFDAGAVGCERVRMAELTLRVATDPSWAALVRANLDVFLPDHAACERKASAMGMAFVVRYPDRPDLVERMIAFAREELEHFQMVYKQMRARGLALQSDVKDPYVGALLRGAHSGGQARLLDHLLIAAVVEARGTERFALLAEALGRDPLGAFYADLATAERRHARLFLDLAERVAGAASAGARLAHWLEREADLVRALPLRAALH